MSLITALIHSLKTTNLPPLDAEQIADAIWLAAYLGPPMGESTHPPLPEENELSTPPVLKQNKQTPTANRPQKEDGGQPAKDVDLGTSDRGKKSQTGMVFPTPGAEALPDKLALSRALRPLVRYLPSQNHAIINEQQSAELMAETRLPLLVLEPEKERWLKGIILVDTWPSMGVWAHTTQEFTNLLTQLGAFTRLQNYAVVSDAQTAQLNSWPSETTQRLLTPQELIDPTGRTLIFLLTDFASPAWATGAMGRLLEPLAQGNHLTVISLIPDSRWSHTILADGVAVRLAAPYANAPNQRLTPIFPIWYEQQEQQAVQKTAICPPLPLTILTPQALPRWTQFFLGKPTATVPGYYLPLTSEPLKPKQKPKQKLELTEKLWEHFVATTPREIRRLAAYLATAPLTLPVMRLLQQEMLPKLTQADLATLLDSYLMYPIAETVDFNNPHELQWEFIDGARERLLTTIPLYRIEEVFERVSAYIEKHSGSRYNFHSYIFLPEGSKIVLQGLDDAFGESFARLSLTNLKYLGEKYKKVAAQLAKRIQIDELFGYKTTQLEKSDLQDWSRDLDARLIQPDNSNRVFEPPFPRQLHKTLHEAGNPFPYLSAEDEISSLVKKRLFWDRHPVFYSLLHSQDKIIIVHGELGSGRTAFCWGLYAYEPYHTANDFLIYVPHDTLHPPQLREQVAQNIWSYIAHKPTLLNKLDQTHLHLLTRRLAQVLGYEETKNDLRQWITEYPWVKRSNIEDATLVKEEGLRCLNMFQEALDQLNEPIAFTPNEEVWLSNIRAILHQIAFRFEKFRILLDYQGTMQQPETLRTQISKWSEWGVNVVVFMTTTEYERHFPRPLPIPTYELTWSPEQLRELVYYRIGRQLRNHDRRRAVGNSDNMVNTLFASPEAREAWLSSGKTPRELFAVWQKMLELYSGEDGVFTKSLVDEAKVLATDSENILAKEAFPHRDKTDARDKRITGRLRDEYDGGMFVGRQEAITQAEQWRYSGKRLLTITGIAGIGKTWLLNHLVQLWDAEADSIILHLDLQPYIDAQQTEYPRERFGESTHFFEAARQFIEQSDAGIVYKPSDNLAIQISQVAERLCEKYVQGHLIYFFLDGADSLSPEEWATIESQMIEPLCRCEELHFVISLRESQRIQSFALRSQEERLELSPLAKEEGYKQLKLFGINEKQVDGLIAQGYQLEHPGINTFLATKILDPQSHSYIDVNFLRELLIALDSIPIHHPDEVESAIKLLLELADLPDQWNFQTYRNARQLSINKGWEEIDFLQQHHLILFVPNSAQLFRIAPGLLPFLRIARKNMTRK